MLTLIKGGYLINPQTGQEGNYDILIEGDRIVQVAQEINIEDKDSIKIIDAKDKLVMPGFIDLHVHLREPGFEYKETIKTGAMAAAAGGYTTICPMPNTRPATDSAGTVRYILEKAREQAIVNILPVAAVSMGQEGTELTDIEELQAAGAVAISEDGKSVMDTGLYREGMYRAALRNMPVFAHCEDKCLVKNGVVNAGEKARELDMPGITNAVEDVITARDIILAKDTGARLHLCHVSTRDSVKMLALGKKEGIQVTGEVCPHHFILTDSDIPGDDSNYKMNPPLRAKEDVEALIEALRNGTMDVIATDHAPHSSEEKEKSFREAPFGIVGLETAFALTLTELVKKEQISLMRMVELMSTNPARILGIDRGNVAEGYIADIVIADQDEEYHIDKNSFFSLGRNTPFHGKKVKGRILYTLVNGQIVYEYK